MTSCLLCGVESLEDNLTTFNREINQNEMEVYDLIHLYLPFCEIQPNIFPTSICSDCTKDLNNFHNFYTKIEEIYLHNKNKPQEESDEDLQKSSDLQIDIIEEKPRQYRRRTINNQSTTCDICNEQIDNFASAMTHFKIVHNQPGYLICCNRKFKQQSLFIDHLELHENPEKFLCKICNKKFSSSGNLKTHLNHHSKKENYFCDLCERKFTNKYKITAHMKENHLSLEKFSCEKCDRKFLSQFRFENHKKSHEVSKTFCCEICGRELKTSTSLREHMNNTHSEQTDRIECKLCGHFLKNSYSMRKHMNRHQQMKQNIKCEICQKPCTTKAALSSHMRMKHLLQRIIPCRYCDKKFKQKIDRDEHESTHTGVDRYKCEFCNASFKFGANFRAHRKNVHPVEYEKVKPKWLRRS